MTGKHQDPVAQSSYGWLSSCLRWPSLLIFTFLNLTLLTTVISLTIVSSTNDGFVTIPSRNASSPSPSSNSQTLSISWDLGLLWTTLPSFVFSLFGAYWAWMTGAIAERQPYVELRKEGGSEPGSSIMLDYRVVASIWRWWGAFRRSHYMVGATTLMSVLLTYAIAPFAARLFALEVVRMTKTSPIVYNEVFNNNNINATLDWRPVLDTVAATLIYQGNGIAWTDDERAFRPFYPKSNLVRGADISANTTAYSAYLDCVLVKDYTITSDGDSVDISGNDRGCSFKQSFGVNSSQRTYFKTTSKIDCSSKAHYSRLVFTAATYSSSASNNLNDLSVISCATGYRQVAGTLTVTPSSSAPIIGSFTKTGEADTGRPKLWRVFEQGILGPVSFNPQAKWSTSDMGSLILYYAQQLQPSKPLASEALMDAASKVFTAIYLNAVAIHGFDSLPEPETGTGTALIPTTRLFVVPWVAYIIIVFLMVILCSVVAIYIHLQRSPSIMTEEPEGLLSMAGILCNSELFTIAWNIRHDHAFDGSVLEMGRKRPEVMERKWGATQDVESDNWVVRSVQGADMGVAESLLSR
ncbi:uncharacterized protein B0J16DRAFT_340170 [Fusarium flagelliforme]|uniref:uncharacterized protein n=1 Tax=Fusarium flagelliforme TaxID=2675880 RepID=UPI001E8E332B|nr:uncharacterized protein B0J16DRAFT_340170 [Fusarium flagelliforme]KAH7184549.1 hypothetical protein B0J16DRAFT_340170 [Fusarium flagelliforme]